MTEQRKWPDNWEWVDKEAAAKAAKIEEHLRKTEAAAKAAKIEDRMTITEAAAYVRSTLKPSERGPTHQEILTTAKNRWHVSGLDYSPQQYAEWLAKECRVLQADQSWFKPEVDEATLVTRKMFARMEEVKGYTARSSDYHFGHADKENHFQTARAVIAEALAAPDDVEKAARWIFDNSDGWTEDAKANAQKLAEYALRGKQ